MVALIAVCISMAAASLGALICAVRLQFKTARIQAAALEQSRLLHRRQVRLALFDKRFEIVDYLLESTADQRTFLLHPRSPIRLQTMQAKLPLLFDTEDSAVLSQVMDELVAYHNTKKISDQLGRQGQAHESGSGGDAWFNRALYHRVMEVVEKMKPMFNPGETL